MLDQLSELPAPTKENAIKELYTKIISLEKYNTINKEVIEKIVTEYIENYPSDKMGSLAGWHIFTKNEIFEAISSILDNKIKN